MIARIAALLVLISQGLVLWVVADPRGTSAIAFAFGGHAALALGIALARVARARRVRSGAEPPR